MRFMVWEQNHGGDDNGIHGARRAPKRRTLRAAARRRDADRRARVPVGDAPCQTDEARGRCERGSRASSPSTSPDTHLATASPSAASLSPRTSSSRPEAAASISCGVICLRCRHCTSDVADWDRRRQWIDEVEMRTPPASAAIDEALPRFSEKKVEDPPLRAKTWMDRRGLSASTFRWTIPSSTAIASRARATRRPQLGSVGGGNHFVEMQVDAKDGSVWVMIHCGSRGYGWQTANHYFYAGAGSRSARTARGLVAARRRAARPRVLGASPAANCMSPTATSSCTAC